MEIELCEKLVLWRCEALVQADVDGLILNVRLFLHEDVALGWFEGVFFEFIRFKSFVFFDTEAFREKLNSERCEWEFFPFNNIINSFSLNFFK